MAPRTARLRPFICTRCRHSHSTPQLRNLSTPARFTSLPSRTLIRLAGPDAASFLHNILPAKILAVGTSPVYTAFLSAHGRILNDVFIYPPSWDGERKQEWFVEVDTASAGELMKHLRKHKLRAKFLLERVDGGGEGEVGVVYGWPGVGEDGARKGIRAGGRDPRPGMGVRMVVDGESRSAVLQRLVDEGAQEATDEDYMIHRVMNGLAEGQQEIVAESALPQESNVDFLGGIDFHKGCYLGQELTIRTHHTGVVRKRILPCQIYDEGSPIPSGQAAPEYKADAGLELPPAGANLSKISTRKGRSTGRWLGGVGNIGLALCRLEMMTNIQLTADTTNYNAEEEYRVQWDNGEDGKPAKEVRIKPFVPGWVREGIEQSLRRKEKKPRRRDEEDDEELD